jgi:hypothetical protein
LGIVFCLRAVVDYDDDISQWVQKAARERESEREKEREREREREKEREREGGASLMRFTLGESCCWGKGKGGGGGNVP